MIAKPKSKRKAKKTAPACKAKPSRKRVRRGKHHSTPACAPHKKHKTKKKRKHTATQPKRVAQHPAVPPVAAPPPPAVPSTPMQPPKPVGSNPPPVTVPPTPTPTPTPLPAGGVISSPLTKHSGPFTTRDAERLLWRAAFGPAPGQAEKLAAMGLDKAVLWITRPQGSVTLTGPAPTDAAGNPLQPGVRAGHDEAYWLDRMIRTSFPLIERMALNFHDWFANDADIVQHWDLSFAQTNVFRKNALGSFHQLLLDITQDPSMILFLDLNRNAKGSVNENYARELMELFSLGADRGAYTETDIREAARALTGWYAKWSDSTGWGPFHFDVTRWDPGSKTIYGHTGNFNWQDVCQLIVQHPRHPSFFVTKLWSYFIPVTPTEQELDALCRLYVSSGHKILPVVEAILTSETFYASPSMVKPPVVFLAGLLRARGRYIDDSAWYAYTNAAGQRLYFPPDVAGWDENLWLNPDTMRGRWQIVTRLVTGNTIPSAQWATYPTESAEKAVADALAFWSYGSITPESRDLLIRFGTACDPTGTSAGGRAKRVNALRQLVPSLPDYQTC